MRYLTMDSSTRKLMICAVNNNSKVGILLDNAGKHGKLLAPAISNVLEYAELNVKDLDFLGCGIGPGSLTGLRVGISTIKGLAIPWEKPIAGFNSLDMLSRTTGINENHVVLRKGRKGYFYWQRYNKINKIGNTCFNSIEELHRILEKDLILIFENEKDSSSFQKYRIIISPEPSFEVLTEITSSHYNSDNLVNVIELKPLYMQKSIAEINWEKKHNDKNDSL
ncbi:MAG: tRNA (adenosine(37)-N6)-threonylcarbamoyltransferase complex dimerization subunit type 1 TsaB [Kosmotogaceae bacterium]